MSPNPMGTADVTDNDRLWAAISWVIPIIGSIIALVLENTKSRPFVRYHAIQSLIFGVVAYVLLTIVATVTLGIGGLCCIVPLVVQLYYASQAYQGSYFEVPFLTNFAKQQGWLK